MIQRGKLPPQALDLEEAVLGACLMENQVMNDIPFIKVECFYKETHQHIWQAMVDLKSEDKPVDMLMVSEQLRKEGFLEVVGGCYALTQLTNNVAGTYNTKHHALILMQKYLQREVIRISMEFINKAFDDGADVFQLIDELRLEIEALDINAVMGHGTSVENAVDLTIKDIKARMTGVVKTYYDTGWPQFDATVGVSGNEIMLIGGPAGHGKTKFVIALMMRLLQRHNDIAIDWYSFEDPTDKLIRNMIASLTFIQDEEIKSKRKKLTAIQLTAILACRQMISSWDIQFHEDSMSIKNIKYNFQRFCERRQGKLCICIIDNMLLLSESPYLKPNDRDDFIMKNISEMRKTTKGLIIPIHHFNDAQQSELNIKNAYRPVLKHLKGSEAYRRVPTIILLVNKPGEYSDILNLYPDREELRYLFITDLVKNRDGSTIMDSDKGLIRWLCHLGILKFEEL